VTQVRRKATDPDRQDEDAVVAAEEKPARKAAPAQPWTPPARQPDFVWGGRPVYRCHQGCGDRFERIDDLAAVEDHERTFHPTNTSARPSLILGADGRPLTSSD
jgi:hypothetical protein